MAKVRQSNEWTESDAVAEVAAADPSDFVLETFPPEYVDRISRFIESSSVLCSSQNREDNAAEGEPAEADSDSADSLFITQKPVPEAVRSGRRKRRSLRSGLTSPREREESEDDSSPSASPQDTRSKKRKKKETKLRMPKYSFPFLKDKMPKAKGIFLSEVQNTRLHYSSMGAFFDCIRKMQQSYQTVEDLESNLPAIDVNGECISPISEGEENLGDEDMKVVAKKHFVIPSKRRHSQSWYNEKKRNSKGKQWREGLTGDKMPPGGWGVVLHKIPAKKPSLRTAQSSDLESSDDEDPSCSILREKGTSNKQLTPQSVRAQTVTLKTNSKKRDSSEGKEMEDELSDSSPPQSPKECMQKCRVSNKEELSQEGRGDSEPADQSFFQSDTNNVATCSETKVKKKQNHREHNESAEEADNESQEEVEVQYAALSVNEEITEVEESPHLSQTISELELNEKYRMEESDIFDSEQRKKKKDNQENENAEEEKSHDELEDQHTASSLNEEITEVEETQHLSQTVNELDLNAKAGLEDSDVPDSQQKKVKEDNKEIKNAEEEKSQSHDELEDQHDAASVNDKITEVEEETPCLSQVTSMLDVTGKTVMEDSDMTDTQQKKKKKKKKKVKEDNNENKNAEEEQSQSQDELEVQGAAASANEEIIEEEERDIPHSQQKKKKKKKRKKSPEEHEKEKMKKKMSESNDGDEEDVKQSKCNTAAESLHDDVEIPTKKKKKKKGTEKKKEFKDEGEGFRNTEAFQENLEKTLESSCAKRKKHKKSSQRDESNTPEDEENPQKTDEIEDHDAGLLMTKKKKKIKEMSSMEGSNDTVAQSSDLLSVQRKKKKRKSFFLGADVEGKAAHSEEEKHCPLRSVAAEKPGVSTGSSAESAEITVSLDESNDRVRKKKKRKMLNEQESVEKDLEPDFEELEEALSDTGLKKKKKKRKRNETKSATPVKGSENADTRCSDEAVVLKTKREKNIQETPAAASEETESESLFEHASPSLDTPGKDRKKKTKGKSAHNVSLWSKEQSYERLITSKEGRKTDMKERKRTADCSFTTQLSKTSVLPSPHSIKKNKPKKLKRTLHNPSGDFLTHSQYQ
ncbi:trichohyalin-like [Pelmatolapia mariae]|uniref:trichohyalin-like n=1 Tax=Pelmatolapia mariae TaxID=158779 RepID=UPI002FE53118